MTEINSSWLVGSFTLTASVKLTVNGDDRTISAGTYYLYDATNSLSLAYAIQTQIAAVVPGSTVRICKDRKLRIVSGGVALTVLVPSPLRAVLGLAAAPAVGTTVTADDISILLWSPGWPETSIGHPVHSDGYDVHDRVITSSPTGLSINVTTHHSVRLASWAWYFVKQSRAWSATKSPGEFVRFFDDILIPGRRFKLYSQMDEDEASSTAVTWVTAYGPYVMRDANYEWYRRSVATSDALGSGVELAGVLTSEIT